MEVRMDVSMASCRDVVTRVGDETKKIGVAYLQADGTIRLYLEAFPADGKLTIRDKAAAPVAPVDVDRTKSREIIAESLSDTISGIYAYREANGWDEYQPTLDRLFVELDDCTPPTIIRLSEIEGLLREELSKHL